MPDVNPTSRFAAAVACLVLAATACITSDGSTTIGGAAPLGEVVADAPFYDGASNEVLIEARRVSTTPLAEFDVPDSAAEVVDGSVRPIGQLGDLRVGAWRGELPEQGPVDCVGSVRGIGSSVLCSDEPAAEATVHVEVTCRSDEPPEWIAFTVGDTVDALRLEVAGEAPVVGDDPQGTGLVAVEATGTVSRITAQTSAGEVRLVDAVSACPAG